MTHHNDSNQIDLIYIKVKKNNRFCLKYLRTSLHCHCGC